MEDVLTIMNVLSTAKETLKKFSLLSYLKSFHFHNHLESLDKIRSWALIEKNLAYS